MRLLKIARSDLGTRNVRGDRQHGGHAAVRVVQTVDQVQIAGAATAGTHGQLSRQLRLGAGREGRRFLVANMHPVDLLAAAQSIGHRV